MVDKASEGQSGKPDADRKGQPETSDPPRKSLSALLAEWEETGDKGDGGKPKAEPKGEPKESADDIAKRLEAVEGALTKTNYETDMKSVVEAVKGDLDVDDWLVESWVNRKADSDPRLVKLWEGRDQNRSRFDEAIKALAPEFQEYAKSRITPAKQKEDEVEEEPDNSGLTAAVRNSRDAQPRSGFEDVNFSGLDERNFALKKSEVFKEIKAGRLT